MYRSRVGLANLASLCGATRERVVAVARVRGATCRVVQVLAIPRARSGWPASRVARYAGPRPAPRQLLAVGLRCVLGAAGRPHDTGLGPTSWAFVWAPHARVVVGDWGGSLPAGVVVQLALDRRFSGRGGLGRNQRSGVSPGGGAREKPSGSAFLPEGGAREKPSGSAFLPEGGAREKPSGSAFLPEGGLGRNPVDRRFSRRGGSGETQWIGVFSRRGGLGRNRADRRFSRRGGPGRNPADRRFSRRGGPRRNWCGALPFARSRGPRRSRKVRGSAIRVGGGAKRRRRHYIAPSR